ncbi:MAG TPA: xylulokinase, partial [Candidatus Latescibacteria bacterium]|nr:xylulokinase [Candidatus Latescibacterota bacterium]
PGHMARALFEGMAVQLADAYREAVALGAGERSRLVGSGNGLKLNALLREALAAEFGMPVAVGLQEEEAAVGAALCAAVADGAYASIAEASAEFIGSRAEARD